MDRLRELEVFVATADAGSLAGAARILHMSPPAVTRAIASLEQRLGIQVFNRTTRNLNITEGGSNFLDSARRILADLQAAEQSAAGEAAAPHGHLKVSASVTLGRMGVVPVITEFLKAYPKLSCSALLLDRMVDLVEEGVDVAVRIGNLQSSSLVARKVGAVRRILVASPSYLSRAPAPSHPSDLKDHDVIAFTGLMPNREWRYVEGRRTPVVAIRPLLEVNDASTAIAVAQAGTGITIALSYMVADRIRDGRLVPVLSEFSPAPVPVHLVYPNAARVAPKVRAFIGFAAPALGQKLQQLSIGDHPGMRDAR